MRRLAPVLFVLACSKSAPPAAKQATAASPDAARPVDAAPPPPDVRAYVRAVTELHACQLDRACVDAAIDRALAAWPASPTINLLRGRRLADAAAAAPFAKRALEVVSRDERIHALELAATTAEATGDRAAAVAALTERLALRGDHKLQQHADELAGAPIVVPRDAAFRLGGPFPSIDFYCDALAAEHPSPYGSTHCLPGCTGVDEGPATATAAGWTARLIATVEDSQAVAGSTVSCDLALGDTSGWYLLRDAASCAPCGHAPFPATADLATLAADPTQQGRGHHDNAPVHDASISEELAFRDLIPGGAPELVFRHRARSIYTGAFDEDRNHITRDDTHTITVCGRGPSNRWSCLPTQTVAQAQELVPLGPGAPSAAHTTWTQTLTLDHGTLELTGDPKHRAKVPLAFP